MVFFQYCFVGVILLWLGCRLSVYGTHPLLSNREWKMSNFLSSFFSNQVCSVPFHLSIRSKDFSGSKNGHFFGRYCSFANIFIVQLWISQDLVHFDITIGRTAKFKSLLEFRMEGLLSLLESVHYIFVQKIRQKNWFSQFFTDIYIFLNFTAIERVCNQILSNGN